MPPSTNRTGKIVLILIGSRACAAVPDDFIHTRVHYLYLHNIIIMVATDYYSINCIYEIAEISLCGVIII